ncbi:hypothetical protein YC2023_103987 [Brassica napus]
MSEHMVVYVDRLMQPVPSTPVESETPEPFCIMEDNAVDIYEGEAEEDPLVWWGECRICQEESAIKNLESPCSCNGSLKPYQAGYTSPPPPPQSDETTIDIGGGWTISGLDLDDPNLLAIAEAERQILELEYDDYTEPDTTLAAFFRISALILMTLLLRYALTIPDYADGEEEDPSSILSEAEALATRFALVLSSRQPRDMVNYLSMEP